MRRLRAFAFIVCVSLAGSVTASAQTAAAVDSARAEDDQAFVRGLSAGDLLKVREEPSPLGKTLGRLPNGAIVEKLECEIVDSYEWCRVNAVDVAGLAGWTPSRYLLSLDELMTDLEPAEEPAGAAVEQEASAEADDAPSFAAVPTPRPAPREQAPARPAGEPEVAGASNAVAPVAPADRAGTIGTVEQPVPAIAASEAVTTPAADQAQSAKSVELPAPAEAAGEAADATEQHKAARRVEEEAETALPPGMEARFAGAAPAPLVETTRREAELALAPAATVPEAEEAIEGAAAATEGAAKGSATSGDAGVPVPTPRPGSPVQVAEAPDPAAIAREEATELTAPVASDQVALATASTAAHPTIGLPPGTVAGEIPCARYVGQPMARCLVLVARTGTDAADVTVVWPDGGARVIEFRDGSPKGSNSHDEFRFTREGALNMIRIGGSERFEILDALAFDD